METLSGSWFPPGTLFLRVALVCAVPLAVFAVMLWQWSTRTRDTRRRTIVPQHSPPADLTPTEVMALAGMDRVRHPSMNLISLCLVDLAIRGYILIEERTGTPKPGPSAARVPDYLFHLRKPPSQWKELRGHERALFEAMFSGGHSLAGGDGLSAIDLGSLKNAFRKLDVTGRILDELVARGYYSAHPEKLREHYMKRAAAVMFAVFVGGVALAGVFGFLAAILSFASVAGFGWFMPALSAQGARTIEGVLGFGEFLAQVEADRLGRIEKTPEVFEKYLPYAIALEVENNWSRAFDGIYHQAPAWYRAADVEKLGSRSLVGSIQDMADLVAKVMTSPPGPREIGAALTSAMQYLRGDRSPGRGDAHSDPPRR